MKNVVVIISTYKAGKKLERQLDSIFSQKGVNIRVYIRDDSSPDNTVEIIESYKINHPNYNIDYIVGENLGYALSFLEALEKSGDADYYAFSDQDDVWIDDKIIKTINPMEDDHIDTPKLAYCNMRRSDENLNIYDEQINILKPHELTKKIVLTQTFNYGAATVFNRAAKKLICRCKPKGYDIPHDYWAGLLCFWFGQVFYVDDRLYYWIRYDTSVSGEGTKKSGRLYRIRECIKRKSYPNVSYDLLNYYSDLLEPRDKVFLEKLSNYKEEDKKKIGLLFDFGFRRKKISGTVMLKLGILMNWY